MREKLSSRLGFILLSAGCAIGIGNVWRFPYVTGQSGGGCFVLLYLFFLALLGIPVLVMEFACGRASQRSIAKLHATLTPGRKAWGLHGVAGLAGCVCLLMFYTTVAANAMNQAFFTLSLGIGSMAIFGSYVGRERTLLGEAANVAALDTFVAICAGLVILPACFAFGIEPGQGPGLVFVTLPNVFSHMPCGRLWGALFFLFMSFAALTTVLAVFENIVACLADCTGWNRRGLCALVGFALVALSVPCVLGFNVWSSVHPLGAGTNILDLEDFVVSDILLPLGSLAFALYCTHRFGWGWKNFCDEANAGRGLRVPRGLRAYCAWVLPTVVLVVFILGLVRRFS